MPVWLERRDIDFYYQELMQGFGGLSGPADGNAVEATLAKPQQLLSYEPDSTLYQLAAAIGYGFVRNHCFPDGNKRIALAAMDIFLMLNDIELNSDEAEMVAVINTLASGNMRQEELAEWLKDNCRPVE